MTSLQDREYIRRLEAENQQLKEQLHQIAAQLSWMQTYHAGGMQAIIDRGKQAENAVNGLWERYGQLDLVLNPPQIDVEAVVENPPPGTITFHTKDPLLHIAYAVAIRTPEREKPHLHRGLVARPGSFETFMVDLRERIEAIMWNAPTIDDVKSPYLDNYKVPKEGQLQGIIQMGLHWHDDKMRERYQEQLDAVFNNTIRPYVEYEVDIPNARDAFRRTVERTYQAMADKRATRKDKPQLKKGRRS